MVEFGLKLSDNKTAKWSIHYIDYEKLKQMLKKAKKAREVKLSLEKKYPSLRRRTTSIGNENDDNDIASPSSRRRRQSSVPSLKSLDKSDAEGLEERLSLIRPRNTDGMMEGGEGGSKNEKKTYDSMDFSSPRSPLQSLPSRLTNFLKLPTSADETDLYRRATADFELKSMEFGAAVKDEMRKVDTFYGKKVIEMRERVKFLEEEVGGTVNERMPRRSTKSSSKLKSPLRSRRPRSLSKSEPSDSEDVSASKSLLYNSDSDEDDHATSFNELHSLDPESQQFSHSKNIAESDSIKRAVTDLNRTLKLLSNFAMMNYTGFVKILKKHDKSLGPESKGLHSPLLKSDDTCTFRSPKIVDDLASHLECLYASWFTDGNIHRARAQMFKKVGDGLDMDWSQVRLGYRLGMCAILVVWLCWDCVWQTLFQGGRTDRKRLWSIGDTTAFPVFRACGGLLLLNWCWGISSFIWMRFRINYIFLFEFDPRYVRTPITIFNQCVDQTLVFLWLMLLYYKSGLKQIPHFFPSGVYPFVLVMYTLYCLFMPWKNKKPLFLAIQNVMTSGFNSSTFFTQYVADVFTSLIKVFQDWAWTFCYILSGDFLKRSSNVDKELSAHTGWQNSFVYVNVVIPLICFLPILFRFAQCLKRFHDTGKRWPNLANALKYSFSSTVTLFGALHPLYLYSKSDSEAPYRDENNHFIYPEKKVDVFQYFWISLFIVSSIYSYLWDIFMDWGLGQRQYKFLGPRLMFPSHAFYYTAMVVDGILRCLWVSSLIPPNSGSQFIIPNYMTALVLSLEIIRRTVWGFIRLEKEHRANTEGYRRVDYVPLHFTTGQTHDYKQKREGGKSVLVEIVCVSIVVVIISISSVFAARD